jgi:hypothetical protein
MLRRILEFTDTAIGHLVRVLLITLGLAFLLIAGLRMADAKHLILEQIEVGDRIAAMVACQEVDPIITLMNQLQTGLGDVPEGCDNLGGVYVFQVARVLARGVDFSGEGMAIFQVVEKETGGVLEGFYLLGFSGGLTKKADPS